MSGESTLLHLGTSMYDVNYVDFSSFFFSSCLIFKKVQTYFYSIIPFGITSISNVILIHASLFSHGKTITRTKDQKKKRRTLSITVISINICFFVFTLPLSIALGYFLQQLLTSELYILLPTLNSFAFTYHSSHFFILSLTNKQFSKEIQKIKTFFIIKTNKVTAFPVNEFLTKGLKKVW